MSPVRAIPTSRAYWELRAEQVLNRVFNPEAPIDVEICETPEPPTAGTPPAPGPRPRSASTTPTARRTTRTARPEPAQPGLLVAGVSLLLTGTAALGLLILSLWQQGQQALRQERNLLLVERLRAMGPLAAAPPAGLDPSTAAPQPQQLPGDPASTTAAGADQAGVPPPPSEPWMEELATLPASSAPPANVLRVPMNRRIASPAPASSRAAASAPASRPVPASAAAAADLPQLVGVVQVPGRPGSAIFQVSGSSTSAASGESIGGSGWRLQSANGDSAVIERDGIQRRISISGGL